MKIDSLYLFPVKSLAPVKVESFTCGEAGPLFDREWMLVDAKSSRFLTQRDLPRMALVQPALDLEAGQMRLSAPGVSEALEISLSPPSSVPTRADIWGDLTDCYDMGADSAEWLSAFLKTEVRLVRMLAGAREKTGNEARSLRFVDDYPLHIASLGSLEDLNSKLPSPVSILRFRPNIVLSGGEPWAEDKWSSVKMGQNNFKVGRACTRCTITTVDPTTAERGPEPLKTLAGFRRDAKNKIEFGLYLHTVDKAELTVGMSVTVS